MAALTADPRPMRRPRRAWLLALLPAALLLALLPLPYAAALVGALIGVTLIIVDPAFGLYASILSVPVQDLVHLPGGLTVTQAVVVLAFGAYLLRVFAYPERRLELRLLWPWFLFLVVQLVSVAFTPYSKTEGLAQWARWVASFMAFVLAVGTIRSRRHLWGLVIALLVGPAIAAMIGLVQFVIPSLAPESFLILGGGFARASATFGKPNPFAGYLNMAWPLAAALGLHFLDQRRALRRSQVRRAEPRGGGAWLLIVLFGGFTGLLLAGLFVSYSRGGWIGAIAGLGVMALVGGRRSATIAGLIVVVGLLVGLLGAFSVLPPAFTDRLSTVTENLRIFDAGEITITPDNFAIVERMAHWQAGWRMFRAYPIFGVGVGNFNQAYPDFFVAPWAISQGHAHNYYIHTLAESGIFGLLSYLGLIGAVLRAALRVRRRMVGTVWGAAMVGVCGIISAVAGHNIFENLHVLNLGIQLSGVWGIALLVERLENHEQTENPGYRRRGLRRLPPM